MFPLLCLLFLLLWLLPSKYLCHEITSTEIIISSKLNGFSAEFYWHTADWCCTLQCLYSRYVSFLYASIFYFSFFIMFTMIQIVHAYMNDILTCYHYLTQEINIIFTGVVLDVFVFKKNVFNSKRMLKQTHVVLRMW